MKIIRVVGVFIVILLLTLMLMIYLLPSSAHMERSVLIHATPSSVYQELHTFRNFYEWSPWANKDPLATYVYDGADFGVGARIVWTSEVPDVGSGSMEIVECVPNEKVKSVMQFDQYMSSPYSTFVLEENKEGVYITWSYDEYEVSGLSKIFMLGIDGFLGGDFELGLTRLKEKVESAPEILSEIELEEVEPFSFIGMKDSSINEPSIISVKMAQNFGDLNSYFALNGVEAVDYPLAIFESRSENAVFICGIPVVRQDSLPKMKEFMKVYKSYGGLVLKSVCMGNEGIELAYADLLKFAEYYNYHISGDPWEVYVSGAGINNINSEEDTDVGKTLIYYPVK